MKKIIKHLKNNYQFYLSLVIICVSVFLSYHFLYWINREFVNNFIEGKNIYLSGDDFASGEAYRQLLTMEIVWAFIKVFLTWAIAASLLFLVKIKKNN